MDYSEIATRLDDLGSELMALDLSERPHESEIRMAELEGELKILRVLIHEEDDGEDMGGEDQRPSLTLIQGGAAPFVPLGRAWRYSRYLFLSTRGVDSAHPPSG